MAVIFDLEEFTTFCTKPQIEYRLPLFLNETFGGICSCLDPNWAEGDDYAFLLDGEAPEHTKFLGDGSLVIWRLPEEVEVQENFIAKLLSRLFIARETFPALAEEFHQKYALADIPRKLRFGIAAGEIIRLRLSKPSGGGEYVGFPINLASRLQSYCRELGFIVSGRIGLSPTSMETLKFKQVVANDMRGIGSEIVYVDELDYETLSSAVRDKHFELVVI